MAKRKTNRNRASPLPEWSIAKSQLKGWLRVTCPRPTCGGSFHVQRSWADPIYGSTINNPHLLLISRSCPYCFRVSQLPANAPGAKKDG